MGSDVDCVDISGSDGRLGGKKEKKGKGFYAFVIWDMFVSVRVTVMV